MGDECPFCNERTLSWEEYGNFQGDCAGSRVCTSCGGVVDENNLTADEGKRSGGEAGSDIYLQASAKERQQYNVRCKAPSMSKGRRQGLDLTKRIAHHMDCRPSMTAEAVDLFERLVAHPDFKLCRIVNKLAVAACCVYIICRQHNWPVMLADVCSMVGKSVHGVDSWKRRIMATFPHLADIRSPDLLELLSARCEKAAVSHEVQQTAVSIIKLCRDLWITEGRKQDNIVIPVLFIAWQSEDPVDRVKVKLRNFCRDRQLPAVCHLNCCLANMQQILCQLADKIPWVTPGSVSDPYIAFHVKDIINYRSTLIAEARSEILRIQSAADDATANASSGNSELDVACTSSALSPNEVDDRHSESTVAVDVDVANSNDASFSHSVSTTSVKEPSDETERHMPTTQYTDYYDSFWPPPGYKPYKRLIREESQLTINHPDLDCVHLSSHDIPDEDMHLYLKSTAEELLDVKS